MNTKPTSCPTCGRLTQSALGKIGGKKRATQMWAALTPEQRSAEMSRRRKKGMGKIPA